MTVELKKRVLTGIIGGFAVVALLSLGGWIGVFLFTTIISIGMIYEFTEMAFVLPDRIEKRYVLLTLTWLVATLNQLFPQSEYGLLVLSFLILFSYFLAIAYRYDEGDLAGHFREFSFAFFSFVYLVFIPLFMTKIHSAAHGGKWLILFLLMIWAGDSGAYFVGKKYGVHKLYPAVSPKKSVEGALGGLASGFIVILIFKLVGFSWIPWLGVLFIPIIVGIFSQLGDLCESLLKRSFSKKDSGSILPGHGGFLDRFDGVVFSLPIMYACMKVFG